MRTREPTDGVADERIAENCAETDVQINKRIQVTISLIIIDIVKRGKNTIQ